MGADRQSGVTRRLVISLTGAAFVSPGAPLLAGSLETRRMAFTPTFVDLVRNYTTTTGTGNFVLGATMNGYASFASALKVGDSFYYSAIGIDKPIEREVGRGTLQADGTIGRDPISGTKTNFSNGIKSLSLIAAAEWFNLIQAGAGAGASNGPASVATRDVLAALSPAGLPAVLAEPGCEGLFLFDAGNRSADVSADANRGLCVAPNSDKSGASGAWVRHLSGPVQPSWFGVVEGSAAGANAARNDAAWAAMTAALKARGANRAGGTSQGALEIQYGLGTFEFSAPHDLNFGAVVVRGQGGGASGVGAQTRLKFYNSTGIRIQDSSTSGASAKDSTAHLSGAESAIRDLAIEGTYANGAEAEYHGIHARATFSAESVHVTGFHGDGIRIDADAAGAMGGNANSWRIVGGRSWGNRNGLAVGLGAKADTNVGTAIGFRCDLNRQWGICDASLLGNNYIGCEVASNGNSPLPDGVAMPTSVTSRGGHYYYAVVGQEAGASTNPPSGTAADNAYWYHAGVSGPGPGAPEWFSGMQVRAGGAAYGATPGAYNLFNGCYAEFDQPKMQGTRGTIVIGGALADWVYQRPGVTAGNVAVVSGTGNNGGVRVQGQLDVKSGTVTTSLGAQANATGLDYNQSLWSASDAKYLPNGASMRFFGTDAVYMDVAGQESFFALGSGNASGFGRDAPITAGLLARNGFYVGSKALRLSSGSAPPTSGAHQQGDMMLNSGAAAGGKAGWVCVASGSPGTWKGFGTIDA